MHMESSLLDAGMVSRLIVIKSNSISDKGYAHYNEAGSVLVGEESAFSTHVKIEAERATINDRYVNLRFCNSNKYWARKGRFIVAESNKPEEDTANLSCTMFEAIKVDDNGVFYLRHVQSGGRVLIMIDPPTTRIYINEMAGLTTQGYLNFVNWDTLVKLPKHVAFKGYNGRYLQGVWEENRPFLQFSSDDPNGLKSGFQITLLPDGHVRIFSNYFTKYWRRANNCVWADSTDAIATPNNRDTLFWPVKIDDTTIVLRSVGMRRSLNSTVNVNEARMGVKELVSHREIYNVRYRMEDSRIFNEKPFAAGTTTAFNYSDTEDGIAVEVGYEDEKCHSLSRSLSLTAGVPTTIQFGVPLISNALCIAVSDEINTTLEWNETTTTKASVKGTGTVPVPARSVASVSYVGTMGTCDVPFTYTQQDKSSTHGKIIQTDQIDGVFRGVNAYNFTFVVEKTQPL